MCEESKISITIRRAGQTFKTFDGSELLEKVTNRAIARLLCGILNVTYSQYKPSNIEYQPVFTRKKKGDRNLKRIRVRLAHDKEFKSIPSSQINNIGITEKQILSYLCKNSLQVKAISGEII